MSTGGTLPPTPPMSSEAGFDGRQSPSTASHSSFSVVSAPSYYYTPSTISAINNVDPESQRQHIPNVSRRVSMPAAMTYSQNPFNGSQYNASPGQQSMSSYYPSPLQPTPPQSQVSGLYYQRPLPQVSSSSPSSVSQTNEPTAISTTINASTSHAHPIIWSKSLATSPLYLPIFSCLISPVARSLHLSNLQ